MFSAKIANGSGGGEGGGGTRAGVGSFPIYFKQQKCWKLLIVKRERERGGGGEGGGKDRARILQLKDKNTCIIKNIII